MNCVYKVHVSVVADTISDPMSCDTLAAEDTASIHDAQSDSQQQPAQKQAQAAEGPQQVQRPLRLDILPPPPNTNPTRRSPLVRWVSRLGYGTMLQVGRSWVRDPMI
jgi:hypothetical protein